MREPLPWNQVFLRMAYDIAKRSKDPSTQVGAVLVDSEDIVLSTGFNGPPSAIDDEKVPWTERPQKYDYIIHAEENALWFGIAKHGEYGVKGSTLYCTHEPCPQCILRAIRAKVRKIIYPIEGDKYEFRKMFEDKCFGIIEKQKFPKIEIEIIQYKDSDKV